MHKPFYANVYSVDFFTQSVSLHTYICMLHTGLIFSPLLIHIWEEKYIFLLSDSCIKCMEIRVLKRTATSAKMNKISDSFSGYTERDAK
jgi:hypothetical protein